MNAIVLDVGTYQVKAGYAGEDAPKFICPSVRLIFYSFGILCHALIPLCPINVCIVQVVGVGGESLAAAKKGSDSAAMETDERMIRAGVNALEVPRDNMEVVSPFKDGLLDDWDAVEALWDHMLKYALHGWDCAFFLIQILINNAMYVCRDQMRLTTDEHPMMLAEPSQNEKAVREKMVEIMFEKYNVPGEYIYWNYYWHV